MVTLFNIIAFGFISAFIGRGIVPRIYPLLAGAVILAVQMDLIHAVLYALVFAAMRLLATKPLLDCYNYPMNGIKLKTLIKRNIIRALPIVPLIPFTSWIYVLFLASGWIYYVVGKYRYRKETTAVEAILGIIFGLGI